MLEYTKTLIKITGKNIEPVIPGYYRYGDTRHTVSTSEKLKKLGWKNKYTLEDIFRDYVKWVYEQPDIKDRYEEVEAVMKKQDVLREAKSSLKI